MLATVEHSFCLGDKNGADRLSMDLHRITGPYRAEPHTHWRLELSCVLSGTGTYDIGGKRYPLCPGDVIILNNTEPHAVILAPQEIMQHYVIHFDPAFIWNSLASDLDYNFLLIFFGRGPRFSHRLDRDNPATARIGRLFEEIHDEMSHQPPCYELMVKIKLQTIFTEIMRHYDYVDLDKALSPLPQHNASQLLAAMQYIDGHLEQDLRLQDMAAVAHVSPSYFSTLFKRFNGVSPVEYITLRRIQRATELIRTTSLSLSAVATVCGFHNDTNFYKAFRKVTGRTPSSYRSYLPLTGE